MDQVSFLIANPIILRRAIEAVSRLTVLETGKRWQVVIQPEKTKRSIEQNKRMWSVLSEIAGQVWLDGKTHPAECWHEFFKRKFLPVDTRWLCGELIVITGSTTDLNKKEFAEYMTQIEAHASQELGVRFLETREYFDEWRRHK